MIEKPQAARSIAQIDDLATVLCYPKKDFAELEVRMKELASLHVKTIELAGSQLLGRTRILGKGCVGIVVKAQTDDNTVAVKIRRTDANRPDMSHEAQMLRIANSVEVGPRLFAESENFLVMEFIQGMPLGQWLQCLPLSGSKRRARRAVALLLDDCFKLDQIHLDHGELSNAPKNVLVDDTGKPRIVDFESASNRRRPSNVTAITQYLLLGGGPARHLRRILKWRRRTSTIRVLREYKRSYDPTSYQKVKTMTGS